MLGILVDLLACTIIIPVMPFHLEQLGYRRVSALTGWLLFAYSAGLVLSTPPIAVFSERYNTRRMPLIIGLLLLVGSQVMLMEAPTYAVMSLIGPAAGGALFTQFGYRGPFIFVIAWTVVDLIARLLIIERKEAFVYGVDPQEVDKSENQGKEMSINPNSGPRDQSLVNVEESDTRMTLNVPHVVDKPRNPSKISILVIFLELTKSSRALVAVILTFAYGYVFPRA
ncbi:hypothetical protein C0989_001136 [Termitomyces sp. Mn162]|nr:hypothetical protein C0989_001136 [Termitomyces sp. Mn162]